MIDQVESRTGPSGSSSSNLETLSSAGNPASSVFIWSRWL
jgi:hypothetical protein